MGNKRFDNVGDCQRNGADVIITCSNKRCGHQVIVGPYRIIDILKMHGKKPPNTNYDQISLRLKCSKCGMKWPIVRPTQETR